MVFFNPLVLSAFRISERFSRLWVLTRVFPHLEKMGWMTGLEPATLGTTNRCSNQLSYNHRVFLRDAKICHFEI